MIREDPLDDPPAPAVAAALERDLGVEAADVVPIEEGLNAVYRIDRDDGERSVLKAATLATDAVLLAEAMTLERVGRETVVPVPEVLATVDADASTLGPAYFLSRYRAGRTVTDLLGLEPAARERLLRESGRHLARIHDLRVADRFGPLRVEGDRLTAAPGLDDWSARYRDLVEEATSGLRGEGYTNDPDSRFADLVDPVREVLLDAPLQNWSVRPAICYGDYRPANLILAPTSEAPAGGNAETGARVPDPLIRAVVDFGGCSTGDALLDLALAEDALVDVPLGGTDRADRLRSAFRTAYVEERDGGRRPGETGRYPYYRLFARVERAGAFGYWSQFAREDDLEAVSDSFRAFVVERLSELE